MCNLKIQEIRWLLTISYKLTTGKKFRFLTTYGIAESVTIFKGER